jgi:hypothetical protein
MVSRGGPTLPVISLRRPKELPTPSLSLFVALQLLDVLTTMIGLRAGAREGSAFIGQLMHIGPAQALAISKLIAVALVCVAMRCKRPRLVVMMHYWFAGVVSWNLLMILITLFQRACATTDSP